MAETIKSDQVTPKQLKQALLIAIKSHLPILIKGRPGVGKTDIVSQACQEAKARLIISHPVVSDPTDYKGLPSPLWTTRQEREKQFSCHSENWKA